MRFTIVSSGVLRAAWTIRGLGEQADNMRPAMEDIYMTILEIEDEIFRSQGTRGGREGWLPDSLAWTQEKYRRGLHPGTLQAEGLLRDSVTRWRHPLQYARIEKHKIVFKSQRPFADLHQKGEGGMPKRQFIYFTKQDALGFAKTIKDHIMTPTGNRPPAMP